MTEPLHTVWAVTEGTDYVPVLCCSGQQATALVEQLAAARIIGEGCVALCCHNDPGSECIRDHFDAADTDRPVELLMRAAFARGIAWPVDQGIPEPEYSVLELDR